MNVQFLHREISTEVGDFLDNCINTNCLKYYWVGENQILQEKKWSWAEGIMVYAEWQDSSSNGKCAAIQHADTLIQQKQYALIYDDYSICSRQSKYALCEIKRGMLILTQLDLPKTKQYDMKKIHKLTKAFRL